MSRRGVVAVRKALSMNLSDGTRLIADAYLPKSVGAETRFPVVLERTPYGRNGDLHPTAESKGEQFANSGYVYVVQDVRGCGQSEGRWLPFIQEADDGKESIEWVQAQEWSNGAVYTTGLSYGASAQLAAATQNPRGLAGMFVAEGMSSYYSNAMRHGGAFELRWYVYAHWMALELARNKREHGLASRIERSLDHIIDDMSTGSMEMSASLLADFDGIYEWLYNAMTCGVKSEFWESPGLNALMYMEQSPDVPTLFLSGLYDTYLQASVENFQAVKSMHNSSTELVLGPWVHGESGVESQIAGDIDLGSNAACEYNKLQIRFFDMLKSGARAPESRDSVRVFIMGGGSGKKLPSGHLDHGGRWINATEWPLPGSRLMTLYLQNDFGLSGSRPDVRNTADGQGASSFRYDPDSPVPTIGGNISSADRVAPPGGFDQNVSVTECGTQVEYLVNSSGNILTFQSEPLKYDLDVVGDMTVSLWVSSTQPDTDFTAKIVDVYPKSSDYPNGYALNIQDGIFRCRYVDGFDSETALCSRRCYNIEIKLYPISNRWVKGHRIRLDISSSNFPRFDLNKNTGGPLWSGESGRVAINTVHHNNTHSSRIVFHVN